jgi:hypothetical protein
MPFIKGIRTRTQTPVLPAVTTCNIIQKRLLDDYHRLTCWKAVGLLYGISGGLAYRIAMYKYEPKNPVSRKKLGLPPIVAVMVMTDEILQDGTQVLGSLVCARCQCPFVPNTATRKLCYRCSPSRRKNATTV